MKDMKAALVIESQVVDLERREIILELGGDNNGFYRTSFFVMLSPEEILLLADVVKRLGWGGE